jgi:hypothetical protein
MTKKEIQQLMAIVRPAIIAVHGRQPLTLIGYEIGLIYQNTTKCYQLAVDGKDGNKFFVELVNDKNKVPQVTRLGKVGE